MRGRRRTEGEGLADLRQFMTCPGGHALPNDVPGVGSCTASMCVGAEAMKPTAKSKDPEDRKDATEERERLRGIARHDAVMELVPVPDGLEGPDAEEWTRKALLRAAPQAAARVIHIALYGEDEKALRAAERILKSTGFGDQQALGGGGSLIIIQGLPANGIVPLAALPFIKQGQVVDAPATVTPGA